jgi:hypothetical protein
VCNSICFLKFGVHKINFKMVKSGMVMLTRREKDDVTNTDITVDYCWNTDG